MNRKNHGFTVIELLIVLIIVGVLASGLAGGCTVSDGERIGHVQKFSFKGIFWRTWEGEVLLGGLVGSKAGGGQMVAHVWEFSVTDQKVVDQLKTAMRRGGPHRLVYHQNMVPVPWYGSTTYFVTGVEPVDETSNNSR